MLKINNGRYGKFSKINKIEVLAFIPEGTKHDSIHEVFKSLKEKFNIVCDCYQSVEKREYIGGRHFDMSFHDDENNKYVKNINKYYEYVLISDFNRVGNRKEEFLLHFDFKDNKCTLINSIGDTKTFKVVDLKQEGYLMKTTKTMIKYSGGIKELYKEIINQMHIDSYNNLCNYAYCLNKKYIESIKSIQE